jgi:hypothetical protein
MVNGRNVSIMREMHHLKEWGHDNFHSINIVPPKEKIKFKGVMDYHNINTYSFPS